MDAAQLQSAMRKAEQELLGYLRACDAGDIILPVTQRENYWRFLLLRLTIDDLAEGDVKQYLAALQSYFTLLADMLDALRAAYPHLDFSKP